MRWPLHYQILAATVGGAVIGLFANPGAAKLPDAQFRRDAVRGLEEFDEGQPGQTILSVAEESD